MLSLRSPWLALVLALAATLPTRADAGPYLQTGPFLITSNCAGCPKGDKGAHLNPAVIEYLLTQPESVARAHYMMVSTWDRAGAAPTTTNPLISDGIQQDLQKVYESQKALIDAETGAGDQKAAIDADEKGLAFARGLARYSASAANEMLEDSGRAQYMWGARWDNAAGQGEPPQFKTPTTFGTLMNLFVVSGQTVSMHIFGQGMVTTLKMPVATFDLSAVPGAFDPAAELTLEQVAQGAKRADGTLQVDFDPQYGFITGAHKR